LTLASAGRWKEHALYDFPNCAEGCFPDGTMALDQRGNLYGVIVDDKGNLFGTTENGDTYKLLHQLMPVAARPLSLGRGERRGIEQDAYAVVQGSHVRFAVAVEIGHSESVRGPPLREVGRRLKGSIPISQQHRYAIGMVTVDWAVDAGDDQIWNPVAVEIRRRNGGVELPKSNTRTPAESPVPVAQQDADRRRRCPDVYIGQRQV